MKTTIGILVAVAIAALAGSRYWRADLAGKPEFATRTVVRGPLFIGPTATGTVEPVEIVDVGTQITGSIKSFGPNRDGPGMTIDARSRVKQGDLLAQLDDAPYQAELDKARANLKVEQAALSRSEAKLKQTQRDFARAERLKDSGTSGEFDSAAAELAMAQADAEMAQARVEQAKSAVTLAETNLRYTTILARIDGEVIDRKVNIGQTVVAGMNAPSLFLLARDLRHMRVWAAVNEADIGDVHEGQRVTFKVDAYRDRVFAGKVSKISYNASQHQNVVMYPVMVEVENTDGKLLPYMTAKLEFEVARRTNAILVPDQALRWRPTWEQVAPSARIDLTPPKPDQVSRGQQDVAGEDSEPKVEVASPTVWIIAEEGLVRPVAVQVGLSDGLETEIIGGELQPGQAVVVKAIRQAEPDFVSTIISQVTGTKK